MCSSSAVAAREADSNRSTLCETLSKLTENSPRTSGKQLTENCSLRISQPEAPETVPRGTMAFRLE